jgi:predicted DNA binding CopG/RHH family protein
MSERHEKLLETDYSQSWESLPEAPALVARSKTAQVTLRLPAGSLASIKAVAAARSLPYHALTRSWITDALREGIEPRCPDAGEAQNEQLNLKIDPAALDQLKRRAHELRRPYHQLAREAIQTALSAEEVRLGVRPTAEAPGIKELMVLLLHARNARGQHAVRGITRLQKLLFVVEQTVAAEPSRFYAFNYGPFEPGVNDAAEALEIEGYLTHSDEEPPSGAPTFAEMMAAANKRNGARDDSEARLFVLSDGGHQAAEQLRLSNPAYQQLFETIEAVRSQWDVAQLSELVENVYERWPKYTERSVIRDEVAQRRERRRKR